MRLFKRTYIIDFLILTGIILSLMAVEVYLHHAEKSNSFERPYELSFYTHEGNNLWWAPNILDWNNPNSLKFVLEPYTIYKHAPNQKTHYFTTNSIGVRGTEEYSKSIGIDRKKRVIVVGGSAAFGHGLKNDDETFQVQIELLNNKFEVINAGMTGHYSGQELTYIVTELIDYNPDVIIAFDGFNDLFWPWFASNWQTLRVGNLRKENELGFNYSFFLCMERSLVDNYHYHISLFKSFQLFFNNLIDRSIILSKVKKKITEIKKQKSQQIPGKKDIKNLKTDNYFEKILNTYTNNLIKMYDICNNRGIQFLVVFQPEIGHKKSHSAKEKKYISHWPKIFNVDNYEKEFTPLYKRFTDRSKRILTNKGIRFIDINTNPEFIYNPSTLFVDFVHPNKDGNTIIARAILQYLNEIHLSMNMKSSISS